MTKYFIKECYYGCEMLLLIFKHNKLTTINLIFKLITYIYLPDFEQVLYLITEICETHIPCEYLINLNGQ